MFQSLIFLNLFQHHRNPTKFVSLNLELYCGLYKIHKLAQSNDELVKFELAVTPPGRERGSRGRATAALVVLTGGKRWPGGEVQPLGKQEEGVGKPSG
jgi:hypothetical protein